MSLKTYLEECREVKLEEIDREKLVDINDIVLEETDVYAKLKSYIEQIKNPYCFKTGETVVKISFSGEGRELSDILEKYFCSLKNQ